MAPKTGRRAISDALESLDDRQLKKFRTHLVDRREEPRIRVGQVQHADNMDLADVMVGAFTEIPAVNVAIELLREINCNLVADELEEFLPKKESSNGASGTGGEGKHFVDLHRVELIQRVSMVSPILDRLLDAGLITQEGYNSVMSNATPQDKMRALYTGTLNLCGKKGKDIFYKILEETDKFLVEDLKGE